MRVSALDRLFVTERIRRQAAQIEHGGGFALPVLQERGVKPDDAPLVATNMRGSFVQVRSSRDGYARFAFTECEREDESMLLVELHRALWQISEDRDWPNRCNSLAQARPRLEALGFEPRTLVVSLSLLEKACGVEVTAEEAEKLMFEQGHVAEIDGVQVYAADIPAGVALLASHPQLVGGYVRADTHLGILVTRADRALVLVNEEAQDAVG